MTNKIRQGMRLLRLGKNNNLALKMNELKPQLKTILNFSPRPANCCQVVSQSGSVRANLPMRTFKTLIIMNLKISKRKQIDKKSTKDLKLWLVDSNCPCILKQ